MLVLMFAFLAALENRVFAECATRVTQFIESHPSYGITNANRDEVRSWTSQLCSQASDGSTEVACLNATERAWTSRRARPPLSQRPLLRLQVASIACHDTVNPEEWDESRNVSNCVSTYITGLHGQLRLGTHAEQENREALFAARLCAGGYIDRSVISCVSAVEQAVGLQFLHGRHQHPISDQTADINAIDAIAMRCNQSRINDTQKNCLATAVREQFIERAQSQHEIRIDPNRVFVRCGFESGVQLPHSRGRGSSENSNVNPQQRYDGSAAPANRGQVWNPESMKQTRPAGVQNAN